MNYLHLFSSNIQIGMSYTFSKNIQTKLVEKATKAKTKVAIKQERDIDCDADVSTILQKHKIFSFQKYLSEFLSNKTLNDRPTFRYRNVNTVFRELASHQYVYLEDKHKDMSVDIDWLKAQNDYISELSTEEMFNLFGYTYHGDAFINNYIRGTFIVEEFEKYLDKFSISDKKLDDEAKEEYFKMLHEDYFPLFFPALNVLSKFGETSIHVIFKHQPTDEEVVRKTLRIILDTKLQTTEKYMIMVDVMKHFSYERFWISVLELYRDSLQDIIKRAPATTKRMMLYRGVQTDFYLKDYMDKRNSIFVAKGFVSTSSSITVAADFVDYENEQCCFMRMYVPKGTRMILMSGISKFVHEVEFLLGDRSQFYITKSSTEKFCTSTYKLKMRVSDMVII